MTVKVWVHIKRCCMQRYFNKTTLSLLTGTSSLHLKVVNSVNQFENICVLSIMRNPQKYLMGSKMQYRGTCEITEEYSDILKKMHGKCLEIGCGPGNLTKDIILPKLPKDSSLVGADESPSMLEYAKKGCQNEKRISFLNMNIGDMRMPAEEVGKYDNIVSFYYLHMFQNLTRTVRNMSRLLQPTGQGLVMFLSHHDLFDLYIAYRTDPLFRDYMEDVFFQLPTLYGCPNAAEIVELELKNIGFEVISSITKKPCFTYDSIEDLQKSLMSMDPFVDRMPDDVREQYEKRMTEEYAKNKRKHGKIIDSYRVVIAQFKKVPNI